MGARDGWFGFVALIAACGGGSAETETETEVEVEVERETTGAETAVPEPPETLIAEAQPPPPPPEPVRLRVGAWNVKKLGHGTTKRFDLLAQIIEANFDLVAIVEVMQRQGGHAGYDQLMTQLGGGWAGQISDSPRPRTSSGNSEFVAILWRPSLARPCEGWTALRYATDDDGGPNGTGDDHFVREPAYGCFEALRNGDPVYDFVVGAYHATWVDGNTTAIREEVSHMAAVFTEMGAARQGERDLWMLGDYNLVPAQLAQAITFTDRTDGTGSTLNTQGNITSNLYDHFVVHDAGASAEVTANATVLDVRSVASSPAEFYRNVSDHLPIVTTVAAGADDD